MIKELEKAIKQFTTTLKQAQKRVEYETIYRFFCNFIRENPERVKKTSLHGFLANELTIGIIKESCQYYYEHSEATHETAIEKYLIAMTYLYKQCFLGQLKIENVNLTKIASFVKYKNDVIRMIEENGRKVILAKEPIPPISDDDYSKIKQYLDGYQRKADTFLPNRIIMRLLMVYGFKLERIRKMMVDDVSDETLRVGNNIKSCYLNLPHLLNKDIQAYIAQKNRKSGELLFQSASGKMIESAFLEYHFTKLRVICKDSGDNSRINATGLAKFGIINMLNKDLQPAYIQLVSGVDTVIIQDCINRLGLGSENNIMQVVNGTICRTRAFTDMN